jgi:hypothetical protein
MKSSTSSKTNNCRHAFNRPGKAALQHGAAFKAIAASLLLVSILTGCDQTGRDQGDSNEKIADAGAGNVLHLKAVGMRFEGENEIAAGWTTIRFDNLSGMMHFALIDKLPDGVNAEIMARDVGTVFQRGMDLINAGDPDGAMEAFGAMPDWFGEVGFLGGPGLLSGGLSSEVTVFLEPGNYMIECYIKTNGIFHNVNPVPGELGMVHSLTVTDRDGGAAEPEADLAMAISGAGFEVLRGELQAGRNTIQANFRDQQVYANFVGHDVHVVSLDENADVDAIPAWMDWSHPEGFETPAPALFVGGIHDMPAGSTAYFTVDLTPGDYAFVAEVPSPKEKGFWLPFTVDN